MAPTAPGADHRAQFPPDCLWCRHQLHLRFREGNPAKRHCIFTPHRRWSLGDLGNVLFGTSSVIRFNQNTPESLQGATRGGRLPRRFPLIHAQAAVVTPLWPWSADAWPSRPAFPPIQRPRSASAPQRLPSYPPCPRRSRWWRQECGAPARAAFAPRDRVGSCPRPPQAEPRRPAPGQKPPSRGARLRRFDREGRRQRARRAALRW